MNFPDHFSKQSKSYARFRPRYPEELFSYLGSLTPAHKLAWDSGTGSGQAALSLSRYFDHVIASDPSRQQISHATQDDRISYIVGAETIPEIKNNSVDLITVAQALHWFNLPLFYEEVRRVGKPRSVFAVWGYSFPNSLGDKLDAVFNSYERGTLGPYWLKQNKLLWDKYAHIEFPFERIETPLFQIRHDFTLEEFLGYISTWSATQRYIDKNQVNPVDQLREEASQFWNSSEKKQIVYDLHLLVGRVK